MACDTHSIARDFVAAVARRPTGGVRIAADAADLVAIDADRSRALIVAGRALADVAPRLDAVKLRRAGVRPSRRMRVARVCRRRRQVLQAVAILAVARAVTAAAHDRIGGGLDAVLAEKVVAMDEVAIDALEQLVLDLASRPSARGSRCRRSARGTRRRSRPPPAPAAHARARSCPDASRATAASAPVASDRRDSGCSARRRTPLCARGSRDRRSSAAPRRWRAADWAASYGRCRTSP